MEWRDRISILSRKRNRRSVVPQPNGQLANLPSSSGVARDSSNPSNSASRESVETTLSQLRPVIGPDHKSYYILLRGNGDLFTCIQPAKSVIHSLDDVVKNVITSVKSAKLLPEVPSQPKRPRYSQNKSFSNSVTHKHSVSCKRNEVGNSQAKLLSDGENQVPGLRLEDVLVKRDSSLGVDSVVQEVALNRTVPSASSEQLGHQRVRTSTFMYPIVQNRLASHSTNNNIVKQEPPLLISSACDEESDPDSVVVPTQDLIFRVDESAPVKKRQTSCEVKVTNGVESELVPQSLPSIPTKVEEPEESDLGSALASLGQHTLQEIRLISREGTVLTEQEIASQIKALIESEQLIIGEDTQIVVLRVSECEAIVRLALSNGEVREVMEQHCQQQQAAAAPPTKGKVSTKLPSEREAVVVVKEEITASPSLSPGLEENCFTPEALVSPKPHQASPLDCLFTSYSQEKQGFEGVKSLSLDPSLGPNCVLSTLSEPFVDSLVNTASQQQQLHTSNPDELSEVGDLEDIGESLLHGAGEIVVFQREDGAFVNQDGIPVSSELQYLIASSQQDLAPPTMGPESQDNHIFVPPEAFEHHTVDVNCEL